MTLPPGEIDAMSYLNVGRCPLCGGRLTGWVEEHLDLTPLTTQTCHRHIVFVVYYTTYTVSAVLTRRRVKVGVGNYDYACDTPRFTAFVLGYRTWYRYWGARR